LCIVKKPAILVPLPTAAEDHQTKNCIALVERNAALLVNDSEASTKLVNNALDLIANASQRKSLSDNIAVMARPDAAQQIAKEVLRLARK
jgi:UDP-N-acetylglucosamine--N-acetylmuramyl-(pentapeptide) pyrophosphoryl-undecaprenol N-acetylglucosamine transferase